MSRNTIYLEHRKLNRNKITIEQWWNFIETQPKDEVRDVVRQSIKAMDRLRDYRNSFRVRTRIRKYVSEFLHSDVHAYEVVRVISPQCVEIRRLDAKCVQPPTEFVPGGFCGTYLDNHNQKWEFASNPQNGVQRLRLGKKGWGKGRFQMLDTPYEKYDYNF